MGKLIYMPGQSPIERQERMENHVRVRSNILAIFTHLGVQEGIKEYKEFWTEVREQKTPLEFLTLKHGKIIATVEKWSQEISVRLRYNEQGYYVGYNDLDEGGVFVPYRKGAE